MDRRIIFPYSEVISAISAEVFVLELGEDEGGADDLGNAPGAGGGVLEDGPSLAEQGKPAFSLEAEAAQQGVPGAGAGGEFLVSAGVFHGDVYADSGAFVTAVGEGRHSGGCASACGTGAIRNQATCVRRG